MVGPVRVRAVTLLKYAAAFNLFGVVVVSIGSLAGKYDLSASEIFWMFLSSLAPVVLLRYISEEHEK